MFENDTRPHRHLDAVAARDVMERDGVGCIRHVSVRVLWIQGLVDDVRLLLYLLGAYHATLDEPVGESEYAELQ